MAKLSVKSYGVSTGKVIKNVWPFFNLHGKVKQYILNNKTIYCLVVPLQASLSTISAVMFC